MALGNWLAVSDEPDPEAVEVLVEALSDPAAGGVGTRGLRFRIVHDTYLIEARLESESRLDFARPV